MEPLHVRDINSLVQEAKQIACPLDETKDLDTLIERIGDARIVMLGESSHGTAEFYAWRRKISQRLIDELGFDFIAVEGDWPDAWRLNQYILTGVGTNAHDVLHQYHRWPTWMWANTEIMQLAEWLRLRNKEHPLDKNTGFYGLDVYSLFESMEEVVNYLKDEHPFLARQVQARYSCFDRFMNDEVAYARHTLRYPEGCHDDVMQNLMALLEFRLENLKETDDAFFNAEQNARVARNAESYYRKMVRSDVDSWNIRDRHMVSTLDSLLERYGANSRGIVWAHNTHIGDYRATSMKSRGEVNLGGLAREKYGQTNVVLVGFGTNNGTVIASHAWDGPIEVMNVPAAKPGSYEEAFHQVCDDLNAKQILLLLGDETKINSLSEVHGQRAIGVVYDPAHERWGNYVPTSLAHRYDAFIFIDETSALTPLHTSIERGKIPETWPSAQ